MDYYEFNLAAFGHNEDKLMNFIIPRVKYSIVNWHKYIECREYSKNTSWTYLFEFICEPLITLISRCSKKEDRLILEKNVWNDSFLEVLYNNLIKLDISILILWFFCHCNYYLEKDWDRNKLNDILLKRMDFVISKGKIFEGIEKIYNDDLSTLTCPLFSLSYRNQNNKEIFKKRCKMYKTICPDLAYNYVNDRKVSKTGKLKIGFISEFLALDSSVLNDRSGLINNLSDEKYDIKIIIFGTSEKILQEKPKKFYEKHKDKYIFFDKNIKDIRNGISELNLDILFFCEIGMSTKLFLISLSRLAPIQINTWGHSDTSGNDSIDYYISSKLFEIENAQDHYSEKLVLFNSITTYYSNPTEGITLNKTRSDFKLPEDKIILGCIQSKFKIDYEFEETLGNILQKNHNCIILLSNNVKFNYRHIKRIKHLLGENYDRLIFFGGMEKKEYLNILNCCDILLDPFPFGGCNTSLEGFDLHKPVVSYPSNFINGLFTYGFYKKMDIYDMIANSSQEYCEIVSKLCSNKEYRTDMSKKIEEKKNLLFYDKETILEYENFFDNFRE